MPIRCSTCRARSVVSNSPRRAAVLKAAQSEKKAPRRSAVCRFRAWLSAGPETRRARKLVRRYEKEQRRVYRYFRRLCEAA